MHIIFSVIGGAGIGPLSLIALHLGHDVSGSDKQNSNSIQFLRNRGIRTISTTRSYETIQNIHEQNPIYWYVYSSAVAIEQPDSPEIKFCKEHAIKTSKRDGLINAIINEKQLQLIAIAGTHGKSTTTAMTIWLFQVLAIPISYSIGAKLNFGDMGKYEQKSGCMK